MIQSTLMALAFQSGRLRFEEHPNHVALTTSVLGMRITLSLITKEQLKEARKAKLKVVQ